MDTPSVAKPPKSVEHPSAVATTPALRGLLPNEQPYTVTDDDVTWMKSKVKETPAAIGVVLAVCFVAAFIWGIQDAVGFLLFPFGVGLSAGLFALRRRRLLKEGELLGIPRPVTKQLHWSAFQREVGRGLNRKMDESEQDYGVWR